MKYRKIPVVIEAAQWFKDGYLLALILVATPRYGQVAAGPAEAQGFNVEAYTCVQTLADLDIWIARAAPPRSSPEAPAPCEGRAQARIPRSPG